MAKNLVAKVADIADVSPAERAAVLAKLPEYVSSAVGALGLLSLRPSENKNAKRHKAARADRRTRKRARDDRAIGEGPKGELLRAIYVRTAMWIAKTATPVIVVASDEDIVHLLPHLIDSTSIRRIAGRKSDQVRTVSQMAFDWRAVIGPQAIRKAEKTNVAVTFYLEGNADARRFSMAVDAGSVRVIERPIAGMAPPIPLSQIIEETKVFHAPYMEWAELMQVAARNGNPVALAAVTSIKAATITAKGAAYVLGGLVLAGLLFFAAAPPPAQAQVIETVERWLRIWVVKNETGDGRLPGRLRLPGKPSLLDENSEVQWLSESEAVFTLRHPEEILNRARQRYENYRTGHIEWEWNVMLGNRAPICKHTENPQLHVQFDQETKNEQIKFACRPVVVVHGVSESFPVGVPDSTGGPPQPPTAGDFDQGDVLIIADRRTYSPCLPP